MDETTSELQDILTAEYQKFSERRKQWRPSLTEYAKWLGVSSASLDQWLLGTRKPDLANTIKLAQRLGPRVYDVMGYPRMLVLNDPKLRLLADNWEVLGDDARREILQIVEREVGPS